MDIRHTELLPLYERALQDQVPQLPDSVPPVSPDILIVSGSLPSATESPYAALRGRTRETLMREYTLYVLEQHKGDHTTAAKELGVTEGSLRVFLCCYKKAGHAIPFAGRKQAKPETSVSPKSNLTKTAQVEALRPLIVQLLAEGKKAADICRMSSFNGFSASLVGSHIATVKALLSNKNMPITPPPIAVATPIIKAAATTPAGIGNEKCKLEKPNGKPTAKSVKTRVSSRERGQKALAGRIAHGSATLKPGDAMPRNTSRPAAGPVVARPHPAVPVFTPSRPSLTAGLDMAAEIARVQARKQQELSILIETLQDGVTQSLSVRPKAALNEKDGPVQAFARQLLAQDFRLLTKDQESRGGAKTYESDIYWHEAGLLANISRSKATASKTGRIPTVMQPTLYMHAQLIATNGKGVAAHFHGFQPKTGRFEASCAALGGERKVLCITLQEPSVERSLARIGSLLNGETLLLSKLVVPPLMDECGLLGFRGSVTARNAGPERVPDYLKPCYQPKAKAKFISPY